MTSTPYSPGRWVRLRLYAVTALVLGALALLSHRAYVLQVREAVRLRAMAEDQYLKDVDLPPRRGRILDRNGAELAVSVEVPSVYANPRLVGSRAEETARALSEPLHLDRRELAKRLHQRRYFTWLKRRVSDEEARAVQALELPGIYLQPEPRRYYPNRGLAGPLLGWAGLDAVGQEGIELQYDRLLKGTRAAVSGLRDALGRAVLVGGLGEAPPQSGHELTTTIDKYIQFRLERALERGVSAHRARGGVAVALDPQNGEVLAMASLPTINPNEPEGARERGARNRAVTDAFEPGSTMKTFTLTGALEAGLIRPSDHWFCENGKYVVGPAHIHDDEPIGNATTVEVLARSSNICASKIAARQGRERLHETLLRFGFGRRTGIDLPGERAGQVRAANRMGPVETATMSFGQGLTATPLQVAAAYAALANGGTWYRPHLLRRLVDGQDNVVAEATPEGHRIVAPELAATVRAMLVAVTQKGGTAQRLSVPGYTFAAKTGTAQKVDPVTRHYSTEKWAASFVGFAPAEEPRLVLFVMIDEPRGNHHGSMVAGPVFTEVMGDALRWLGVAPIGSSVAEPPVVAVGKAAASRRPTATTTPTPTPTSTPTASASEEEEEEGEGEAPVADAEEPRPSTRAEIPDFTGMSMGEALQAAARSGLRLEVSGSGLGTAQSPGPGSTARGAVCRVVFAPPG